MKKIVIASACRTAIGKFGGTLANVPATELGSIVIKEALNRANVKPEQVDHVYMGCVIQAGLGQNVARQAALKAGLPIETPAVTVNVVCGSGLNCVNMAAQMIEAGDADIVVAGGMENMDMAPFALQKARYGYRMGAPMGKSEIVDTMVNDAPLVKAGFSFARTSGALRRGPSSVSNTVSPFLPLMTTGTISSLKAPSLMALSAFSWLLYENSSSISRVMGL